MMKTEQKVQSFIARKHLLEDRQRVLIALSGGADSVCLLLMMKRLGYDCSAAHCNFHLRGEESDRDERFAASICRQQDIPLYITHFDTHSYAERHGVSVEMAARELRYDYFVKIAKENGISTLCVGHHQNDNVETFLLNAVRGTGISGLSGIREMRYEDDLQIVRPLLVLGKDEILDYLECRNQDFVTDSTNLIPDVGRNKIRLEVLPVLESINPSAIDNISTTIDNIKEVQKIYADAVMKDIKRCEVSEGTLSIDALMSSVSPISVLHEWLSGKGFNRTQEGNIIEAIRQGQSGKIFDAPSDSLLIDRKSLVLKSSVKFTSPSSIKMTTLPVSEVEINKNPHYAYLDADKIQGELTVRTVLPSDSFQPFGMRGRRLLSDFMTDHKLNLFEKQQQLVLSDAQDIVWVVGLRASEKYRVDKQTKTVIVVHC